jgi:transcriptional regulator with XRE-family HTH domain
MKDINQIVRENIRRVRIEKGLTQEKLALKTGLHRAYIGQVERGERNIGLTNLDKIAKALNINLKDMID